MKNFQNEQCEKTIDQREWKSAIQELKNGQKEQTRKKELNLKVIENLRTEIQVRTSSLTKNKESEACITNYLSFLKALKVGQKSGTLSIVKYN